MLQIVLGLAATALTLAFARVSEAVDLARFPLAWAGVLVALDGACRARHGRSPLATVQDWLACCTLSVVFWDVFEVLNLRLHNWWYVGLSPSGLSGSTFAALSFATVLPAVRLGLCAVSPREEPPQRFAPARSVRPLLLAGTLALALALASPRFFFGCAWLFLWPLCEAALSRLPLRSLPSPLEAFRARDLRLPLRLIAIALPLGLVWESLNSGCERGWIYTVPFFEHPKLFEMPLPGYLGYVPFLLEAGAALSLLDRLQPRLRLHHLALALAFHFAADGFSRPRTGLSTAPMHDALARTGFLGDAWASRLRALGIADERALAQADSRALCSALPEVPCAVIRVWIEKARSR